MKWKEALEVAKTFLWLGLISFGGPSAHIALMEKELVEKKQWMTLTEYLDFLGATHLIPGPNSTEMAMHCGSKRAGMLGLWLGGISFILPGALITLLMAWGYFHAGNLYVVPANLKSQTHLVLHNLVGGFKPAVLVVVGQAAFLFTKKIVVSTKHLYIVVFVFVCSLLQANTLFMLLLAGVMMVSVNRHKDSFFNTDVAAIAPPSIAGIFWVFLKTGGVLFGSGYVLFAYLNTDLVHDLGWLSKSQLMNAIAVGQFTPGPLLCTATFIGYHLAGLKGAMAATIGVFLPAFVYVMVMNPLVIRIRQTPIAGQFLDGVNCACVALLIVVGLQLGVTTVVEWKSLIIGIVCLGVVVLNKQLNSAWLIMGGGILGVLMGWVFGGL